MVESVKEAIEARVVEAGVVVAEAVAVVAVTTIVVVDNLLQLLVEEAVVEEWVQTNLPGCQKSNTNSKCNRISNLNKTKMGLYLFQQV